MICDDANCHLFFTDDAGHWYRGQTTLAAFPQGFSDPVVALRDDANPSRIFEASNVYKLSGTNKYLGAHRGVRRHSSYHRYYRSWIADSLDGEWTPLQDTYAAPFAGDQQHHLHEPAAVGRRTSASGEMVRDGFDQQL